MRKDWIKCVLGDILYLKNGYAFKSSKYSLSGIPIIRISDINDRIVDSSKSKLIEMSEDYENYTVKKNDILIAMSGATTGKYGIFKENIKAYQNQRVGNFQLFSENYFNKKFLYHLIGSIKGEIEKKAYGGAQPNISPTKIESINISFPPLPEQKAIVAKIEQLFSALDNGIANLKKAQAQLKIYRQAVLKKAFEGELTKEWREAQTELPTADELLKQIKEEREKYYQKQIDDWKEAVKKWEANGKEGRKPSKPKKLTLYPVIKQLNPLPTLNLGELVFQISIKLMPNEAPNLPFIGMDCIAKNALKPHFTYTFKEFKSAGNWFDANHILYGRLRPYLNKVYQAEYEGVASGEFIILETIENVLPNYLKLILHQQNFVHWSNKQSSGDKPRVKYDQIALYNIDVPSIPEQHQIVQEIETRLSVCDNVEANIKEALKKAELLRQSILKKAFEGELLTEAELLKVRNDPEWQPAEKLLKRIKAEKAKTSKQKRKRR